MLNVDLRKLGGIEGGVSLLDVNSSNAVRAGAASALSFSSKLSPSELTNACATVHPVHDDEEF